MRRRSGRPSLLGTMARTAVIAGTASAVSGNVQQAQQAKQQAAAQRAAQEQAAAQELSDLRQQVNQLQTYQQPPSPQPDPVPAAPANDLMAQLQQPAAMHQSGLLSADEFAAAKAKLLS